MLSRNHLWCCGLICLSALLAGCGPNAPTTSPPAVDTGTPAAEPAAASTHDEPSAVTAAENGENSQSQNAAAGLARVESGTVTLTPENTQIQFVGTHVGDKPDPRTGVFTRFSGTAKLDAEGKRLESVQVEIDTASLVTPIEKLTNHLKSPDFFDVREYPTATFASTRIAEADGKPGEYVVTGNLTLLKSTKEVSFPVKVQIGEGGLALEGTFTIDRTEFSLGVGQEGVHKEVEISVWIGKKTTPPAG